MPNSVKINCLIVDDEPFARDLVEGYVLRTPYLELKDKCEDATSALELLKTEKIDLIFLDIQMPEMSGLNLSKHISPSTKIIFTTAFKEYAYEGFKLNAIDYLLKPFNYPEFLVAVEKVKEIISREKFANKHFIFVKSEYKHLRINLKDVYYFEGLKDYVKIWLTSQPKPILTLMSLKTFEQELPEDMFMRVHRSFIVALDKIESVERGQLYINKQPITIAEQYKSKFAAFLENKMLS